MAEAVLKPTSSPPRPVHQVHRSITEVSPPSRIQRPQQHHHHTHNHPHLHSRRSRSTDKHREREPHSSHSNLQPFLDGTVRHWREREYGHIRSEGVTPAGSTHGSRRASLLGSWEGADGGLNSRSRATGTMWSVGREKKPVKEGEVKEERERGALRATELRNAITNLNGLSNDTTRRLDNTYYSVLEKLSVLQASVASLKELASLTRSLNTEFTTESESLKHEITAQITGFQNFTPQEHRIQSLQERIEHGRQTIKTLGSRVDVVRARVESWERAEGAWQEKTRKRMRILWIVMSVTAAVVLGLVMFQYMPAKATTTTTTTTHSGPGVFRGLNASELMGRIPGWEEDVENRTWSMKREGAEKGKMLEKLKRREDGEDLVEDPRLRALDEL